jgi:hypothetical protein
MPREEGRPDAQTPRRPDTQFPHSFPHLLLPMFHKFPHFPLLSNLPLASACTSSLLPLLPSLTYNKSIETD